MQSPPNPRQTGEKFKCSTHRTNQHRWHDIDCAWELEKELTFHRQQVKGLVEALKKFGVHGYVCNDKGEHRMAYPSNTDKCDCGLEAALKPYEESGEV